MVRCKRKNCRAIRGSFLEHAKEFIDQEITNQSIDYQKIVQEQMLSIWKILEEHHIPNEEIFDVMKNLSFEITKILIEEHQKNNF